MTSRCDEYDVNEDDSEAAGGKDDSCYTLNITGQTFGYGLGRKVSETRHTVLGWNTETRQPTPSGFGSGQPTLQHRMIPGQVPAQTGKAQVLPQRKTTLVVITSNQKGNRNARN